MSAAFLVAIHQMPLGPPLPVVITKNVFRHCQMSPGGQKSPLVENWSKTAFPKMYCVEPEFNGICIHIYVLVILCCIFSQHYYVCFHVLIYNSHVSHLKKCIKDLHVILWFFFFFFCIVYGCVWCCRAFWAFRFWYFLCFFFSSFSGLPSLAPVRSQGLWAEG